MQGVHPLLKHLEDSLNNLSTYTYFKKSDTTYLGSWFRPCNFLKNPSQKNLKQQNVKVKITIAIKNIQRMRYIPSMSLFSPEIYTGKSVKKYQQ